MTDAFRICISPSNSARDGPTLDVEGGAQITTTPDFLETCISPSFKPYLKEMIPRHSSTVGFGGSWFWNCYLHAIHGEDIFLDLKGTGVNLSEDSLDAQLSLRKKLTSLEDTKKIDVAVEHCCSKLEAFCAICLSIVFRISQQPMLEKEQGPHALVLCATKDQCDETYALLDRFGSALHLVTHNLFGANPLMPADKRADIVVGTVPLWESVAQLNPLACRDGLEEILYQVSHVLHGTASSTRWRPYSLDSVLQVFLMDLDLQHALGYGPMLERLFMEHRRFMLQEIKGGNTVQRERQNHTVSSSGLPPACQMYCMIGGSGWGRELFEMLYALRDRRASRKDNKKLVRMTLKRTPLHLEVTKNGCSSDIPHKRRREDDDCTVMKEKLSKKEYPWLIVQNALSHSRLMLDPTTFEEFSAEMKHRAQIFWSRFEANHSSSSSTPTSEINTTPVIDVQLAYECRVFHQDTRSEEIMWYVAETVAVITPTNNTIAYPSRTALLMQHLEDELSGQIFDGSVVHCLSQDSITMDRMVSGTLLMYDIFFSTANSISLEPLFLTLSTRKDEVKGDKVTSPDAENKLTCLMNLRQLAVEASRNVKETRNIPLHKFLANSSLQEQRSVLVLRQIAPTVPFFCESEGDAKPLALFYLEECCQYGKVVSYFIFEQRCDGKESEGEGCVHFFVEFATHEGAAEAVRQFSLRFASEDKIMKNKTRAKLFSNALYYEGVVEEIIRKQVTETGTDTESNGDDSDDDDFIRVSLLAE